MKKKIISIILLLFSWISIAAPAENKGDIQKISLLIDKLYKIPNKKFLYSKNLSSKQNYNDFKVLYMKYYTKELVDLIMSAAMNEAWLQPLFSNSGQADPRFIREGVLDDGSTLVRKIIKLKINTPIINGPDAQVTVDYKTNSTDEQTYSTIYFMTCTPNGWRIKDQCLGRGKTKKPDLKNSLTLR